MMILSSRALFSRRLELSIALTAAWLMLSPAVFGQEDQELLPDATISTTAGPQRAIHVGGQAEKRVAIAKAIIRGSVASSSGDLQKALSGHEEAAQKFRAKLQELNIAEDALHLYYMTITRGSEMEAMLSMSRMPENLRPYSATKSFRLEISDVSRFNEVYAALLTLEGVTVERVEFEPANMDETRRELYGQALDDARAKANELAALAGVKLSGIASVRDINARTMGVVDPADYLPSRYGDTRVVFVANNPTIPVKYQDGEILAKINLYVIFALED
jgi:uncharacterized protein YggE